MRHLSITPVALAILAALATAIPSSTQVATATIDSISTPDQWRPSEIEPVK